MPPTMKIIAPPPMMTGKPAAKPIITVQMLNPWMNVPQKRQ